MSFVLRYQTWDHHYDTREFESLGEFHEWADINDESDHADNPMSLVEFHENGSRANSWSERQIGHLRQDRYNLLHTDEIAAEKAATEERKRQEAERLAAMPPYARDYLTELRLTKDEHGNEVYSFDGIVLPFRLEDVQYSSTGPRYTDISDGYLPHRVMDLPGMGTLTIKIPLYPYGDDPTKQFRITRPMEDES